MAQSIKLKRSAVVGKTPQTSSLELGELGINTTDGKIYFHRSGSSDDTIQSVLTTDATITGSLKLSGSQHISGSVGVMDDITFIGDMSSSLTSTSSFSRLISVATASIGYLEVTGSNFATFDTETGSFASGSDVQQILAESASYLVKAETASLGKVTLISDITGSITSTGSFGKIFGDGSDLDNVADPAAISGSYLGLLSGSDDLTLGGGISGSITSTASFGKILGDGSDLDNVADPAAISGSYLGLLSGSHDLTLGLGVSGSLTSTASFGTLELTDVTGLPFATGSDLHQILAESSSYVLEQETGSFASGSDLQVILAESASYVVSTNTGSFVVNSQTSSFASGSDVQTISDTYASGSDIQIILAESASYVTSTSTGSYLQQAATASLGAVGITDTLFVSGNITTSGSVIAREFKTELVSSSIIYSSGSNEFGDTIDDTHIFTGSILLTGSLTMDTGSITLTDGHITGSILSTGSFGKLFGDGGDLTNVADPDAISGSYLGLLSGSNDLTLGLGVSGSLTSTGSFGNLKLVNFGGLPFASGSDLQIIHAESASYVVSTNTGSYASGSDLHQILAESSSYVVESETGSFVVNSQTGSFASGSDLQIIQAESASYVVSTNTGSFVVNSQTGSFASGSDIQIIKAESASYVVSTNTGSFVVNSQTGSFASGSNVQTILDDYAKGTEISGSYLGLLSGSNDLTLGLGVSGSLLSTGSFGNLKLVNYGGLPFASGSDLHQFFAESASYVTSISTGSLNVMLAESASYLFNASTASLGDLTLVGDITGALGESASFDRLEVVTLNASISPFASGSDVSQIQAETGSYATGSDLHQFLAESASYVVDSDTGSLHQVLAESASYLNNDTTSSFGAVSMNSTLFVQGDISTSGSVTAQEFHTELVSSSVIYESGSTTFGDTIDDVHNRTGSLFVSGNISLPDNASIIIGSDTDLKIAHEGGSNYINNVVGNLILEQNANDADIVLKSDNGSGGTTNYIQLDGSEVETVFNQKIKIEDSKKLAIGTGRDFSIEHDGTNTELINTTGNLIVSSSTIEVKGNISGSISTSGSLAYLEITGSSSDLNRIQVANGGGLYSKLVANERTSVRLIQYTTGNQVHIGGNQELTLGGGTIVNDLGNAVDFRVETNANTHGIFLDDSADAVGLFTANPTSELTVEGDVSASGNFITTATGSFGRVNFDGVDGHTFIQEESADAIALYAGGQQMMVWSEGSSDLVYVPDGVFLGAGNDVDLNMRHDGSNTTISNSTGNLVITQNANDKDIAFKCDDGSGGVTEYLFLDGSTTKVEVVKDTNFAGNVSGSLTSTGSFGQVKSVLGGRIGTSFEFTPSGVMKFGASYGTGILTWDTGRASLYGTAGNKLQLGSMNTQGVLTISSSHADTMVISGSRVGIGTASPMGHFDINTETAEATNVYINGEASQDKLLLIRHYGNSEAAGALQYAGFIGSVIDNVLTLGHYDNSGNETQVLHITEGADVGIGTSNPSASLHIFDSDGLLGRAPETQAQDLIVESDGNAGISIISGKGSIERGSLVFGHDDDSFAAGLIYNAHGDQLSLQTQQASNTIRIATGNNDESFIFSGYNISGSLTSTGSLGRIETTTAGVRIGAYKSEHNFPLEVEGHAYVRGPDGWNGNGDLAIVSLGSHAVNENFGVGYKYGTGMILSIYKSGGNGSFGSSTADAVTIADTTGNITLLEGADITGSIASTASFGRIEADQYSLATLTEVSGGLDSTGSFGMVKLKSEIYPNLTFPADHDTNKIQLYDGGNEKIGTSAHTMILTAASHSFVGTNGTTKVSIGSQGETKVSGSILPTGDDKYNLGSSALSWSDVFAVQTTVGAVFEVGLRSKGIGKEETGTIVVWRNGKLVPCDKSEDVMVMGVIKEGKDEPIVMGAEPVLVTGDVKEGDFITTSTKQGHGKKLENGYLLKKEMFGKVIAQALEDSTGESSLIKCMIRKM